MTQQIEIFKFQRSQFPIGGPVLVYNKDKSIMVEVDYTQGFAEMFDVLGEKFYAECNYNAATGIISAQHAVENPGW